MRKRLVSLFFCWLECRMNLNLHELLRRQSRVRRSGSFFRTLHDSSWRGNLSTFFFHFLTFDTPWLWVSRGSTDCQTAGNPLPLPEESGILVFRWTDDSSLGGKMSWEPTPKTQMKKEDKTSQRDLFITCNLLSFFFRSPSASCHYSDYSNRPEYLREMNLLLNLWLFPSALIRSSFRWSSLSLSLSFSLVFSWEFSLLHYYLMRRPLYPVTLKFRCYLLHKGNYLPLWLTWDRKKRDLRENVKKDKIKRPGEKKEEKTPKRDVRKPRVCTKDVEQKKHYTHKLSQWEGTFQVHIF
jgi:hypothetical protein